MLAEERRNAMLDKKYPRRLGYDFFFFLPKARRFF